MPRNITGPPVSGEDLYGRDDEISLLWERLESSQHILMLAPRRVGKTSLMHELQRAPQNGWTVFYSDLEGATTAADCVADMIAHMASNETTRTWLDRALRPVPFREAIGNILRNATIVAREALRVELKGAMAGDWAVTAKQLQARLAALPAGARLLFILDELPLLISTLLRTTDGRAQVERLLGWLRALRQDPNLVGKVSFLVGGSIGLHSLLRSHNMSSPINDLTLFHVEPWSAEVARAFLKELGETNDFPLNDGAIERMLSLLGEAVPYHVQLVFQTVRDTCGRDVSRLNDEVIERAFAKRLAGPAGGPHLDHYAERLERVLSLEDMVIARHILDRACQSQRGMERAALADLALDEDGRLSNIIQLLVDDGYLIAGTLALRFRSNLVREYWRHSQASGRQP